MRLEFLWEMDNLALFEKIEKADRDQEAQNRTMAINMALHSAEIERARRAAYVDMLQCLQNQINKQIDFLSSVIKSLDKYIAYQTQMIDIREREEATGLRKLIEKASIEEGHEGERRALIRELDNFINTPTNDRSIPDLLSKVAEFKQYISDPEVRIKCDERVNNLEVIDHDRLKRDEDVLFRNRLGNDLNNLITVRDKLGVEISNPKGNMEFPDYLKGEGSIQEKLHTSEYCAILTNISNAAKESSRIQIPNDYSDSARSQMASLKDAIGDTATEIFKKADEKKAEVAEKESSAAEREVSAADSRINASENKADAAESKVDASKEEEAKSDNLNKSQKNSNPDDDFGADDNDLPADDEPPSLPRPGR